MRKRNHVGALIILVCLSLAALLSGTQKRVPITREDLATTWIGLSEDEVYSIRFTLRPEGDGMGGYSFLDDEPCIFPIAVWGYRQGNVEIKVGAGAPPCIGEKSFDGRTKGGVLELTMHGNGWRRAASLRPESNLVLRWQKLKAEMERR
jgi:hypothetical protein